jgi:ketosteroid isomerase-like protein
MVKMLTCWLLLIAAACTTTTTDKTNFVQLENDWVAALAKHDTAALDRLLADDFTDTTFRGTIRTKSDVMSSGLAPTYRSTGLQELNVRNLGHTVVVTGVNVLEPLSGGDVVRIRFTDVFAWQDGRWRAESAQESLEQQ